MIFLLIFLFLLICYKGNYQNYQNYIEYDDFENTHMCAENYEKGIGEIIKLREQRPDILLSDLGYSEIDDFDTRVSYVYEEPLPSPPDLFKKKYIQ